MSVTARRPMTMYTSSSGAFRLALDRWKARINDATRRHDRDEARRLAVLVEDVAPIAGCAARTTTSSPRASSRRSATEPRTRG
jgi:hypothetical protein